MEPEYFHITKKKKGVTAWNVRESQLSGQLRPFVWLQNRVVAWFGYCVIK